MNIYAGNLSYEVTEEDLQSAFQAFGQVESVNVIKDRFSGESRGFGFVEMPSKEEGKAAIEGLNGTQMKGKSITVNEAKPKSNDRDRGGRGGGGGRRGGGGGYGGGGRSGGGGGYGGGGRRRY
ncbi:MAG: RNA-binding protein [Spirochaetes bacterium]|nr:RNA-binding protein [Spirochaetota bacterium]